MCFNLDSSKQRPKTAKKDIVVYKLLLKERGFHSYYQRYVYKKGRTEPLVKLRKKSDNIYQGYHSYASLKRAENLKIGGEKVIIFIIPKGTRYYINKKGSYDSECVSERIKCVGIF